MTQHLIRLASFLHLGLGTAMSCLGLGHVAMGVVLMAGFLQNPKVAGGGAAVLVLAWAFGAWLVALAVGLVGIFDVASGLGLRRGILSMTRSQTPPNAPDTAPAPPLKAPLAAPAAPITESPPGMGPRGMSP